MIPFAILQCEPGRDAPCLRAVQAVQAVQCAK